MNPAPELSVIIPTRNCLRWLPRAIASIGDGTDLEIIVIDDGSNDGTGQYLRDLARTDTRLRPIAGAARGPAVARYQGIDAARGRLVAFLDADDFWLDGKLEAQLTLHRDRPEIGLSFTDYRHVTESGEVRGPCFAFWPRFDGRNRMMDRPFVLSEDAFAQIYAENIIGTSTVMVRTDLLRQVGGFNAELASSEDWDLWLRLAALAPVGCVPAILMEYLMHRPGNATGNFRARLVSVGMIAARHQAAARAQDPAAVRYYRARMLAYRAECAEAAGQHGSATLLRIRALARQPDRRALREAGASIIRLWPAAFRRALSAPGSIGRKFA